MLSIMSVKLLTDFVHISFLDVSPYVHFDLIIKQLIRVTSNREYEEAVEGMNINSTADENISGEKLICLRL